MSEERSFHVIIRELCEEMGINMEKKSFGWILKLSKGDKVKYIVSTTFPLNPESSGKIVSDKYATYEVLKDAEIPTVKHTMIFNPANRAEYIPAEGNYNTVLSEFLKYGTLVVKPNSGCEGHGVTLCKSLKEVEVAIQKLFKTNPSVSICPYYDIEKEYRTFYLNGKVLLIYGKTKPFVVGDGVSTLQELITKLNLPEKSIVDKNMKLFDLNMIPAKGQNIELSWKHNLSGGAKATVLEKGELYDEIESLAIGAGKATDVKFATVDIIRTTDGKLYVMEINAGIGTAVFTETVENGYELAKNVFREALKAMFN